MKRWTRKLLAGLLSFGMLLQVASPLSALAADAGTSGGPTLTVTVNDTAFTLHGTDDSVQFEDVAGSAGQTKWNENGLPAVSYSTAEGFKFGAFSSAGNAVKIVGTGNEDVVIKSRGESYAVQGHLTMDNVGDVTIEKNNDYEAALQGGADITCSGTLKIQNNNNGPKSQADFAVQGNLTAKAGSVEVLGTILGDAALEVSGGSVTLKCINGTSVTNMLSVTGANDVTVEAVSQDGAIGNSGDIDHNNSNAAIAKKGNLVLNNCTGTVLVANSYSIGKAILASAAVPLNGIDQSVVRVCNDGSSWQVSTNPQEDCKQYQYLKIEFGGQTQPTTHTLTLKYAEAYDGERKLVGTAGENGTTTYTVENGKELTVKAVAPGENYHFTGWTGSDSNDEVLTLNITDDTTLTANWAVETPEPDEGVPYGITVTMNDDEAIEVTSKNCENILGDICTNGKLTYNPGNHILTGTGSFGKLEINITTADSVDVELSNDAGGIVVDGSLTVDGAQNVTVVSKNAAESHAFGTVVCGDVTINCTGNILLENEGTGDVIGGSSASRKLKVVNAHDVTIRGVCNANESTNETWTIYGSAEIDCTGNVEITSDTFVAVKTDLTVNGAQNVTIAGNKDNRAAIGGTAKIACSGTVTLENKGSGKAVSGELKYTPTHTQKYEIKTGTTAESAETFYTDESGTGYTGAFEDPYINIAPASSGDTTPDDTGTVDSGSDAGGAVAAVLVGSAAVWGGYEVATRVILNKLLPEGAAIPANRGQLALLVWNNAGRPEPAAQPAFADVADADMAKAAQWCVEQGIMEAKTAETFKPEGWTPKFKVIEIWNKAFPKQ